MLLETCVQGKDVMPHADGVVAVVHTSEAQQLAAGGARLTLLLILPFRLVGKWVPGEPGEVKGHCDGDEHRSHPQLVDVPKFTCRN